MKPKTKNQKTPPAPKPAKTKPAKGKANAETVAPVRVRDIGKNCPPMLAPAFRAVRGMFEAAAEATRPLRSATPEEEAATRPAVGAKVEPWRDWARRLCERSGRDWEAFERDAAKADAPAPDDLCGMIFTAAQGAFRDFPPAVAEAGLQELERALSIAAGKPKAEGIVRCAVALNALPRNLRRLAESPEAPATPTANASANPATPGVDNPADGAKGKQGKAKPTRGKRPDWGPEALAMARAFEKALPRMLPDDSPLNAKGELDARGIVGGWKTVRKCFDLWAARDGADSPGLRGFPRGADAEEKALRSLFRALKDSTR